MFDIAVACLVVTALFAYVNERWIRLPGTVGVMTIAMVLSLGLVVTHHLGWEFAYRPVTAFLNDVDFSAMLMDGMLSLLLFAGALHVRFDQLRSYRLAVLALSIVATLVSTVIVGWITWMLAGWAGLPLSLWYCMVFGALISPTDPVAVMGLLQRYKAPASMSVTIAGESLFNDGVGVVLFVLFTRMAVSGQSPDMQGILHTVGQEVGGGLALGLALGLLLNLLMRSIDNYVVEVMLTLAGVLGGYQLALHLECSGPLAMVVTGLLVGNAGRASAMSELTRQHVDMFWELMDQILNAVLFVFLGLELLLIPFSPQLLGLGACAVGVALLARFVSAGLPTWAFGRWLRLPPGSWKVLTWGGVRGGISVALALSLPAGEARSAILALTYCVVVFSLLVQGMTMGGVLQRTLRQDA
ncbi:MAG: cation:proton antiporter [Brachymonas sp.]|jgi:CPA1 family monovalent cation:H+ antiporter|uniref:cation:proton antiporter n=1 Tax=Brachymonas sp. TaxID=1936292 RepID=UPI0035B277F6